MAIAPFALHSAVQNHHTLKAPIVTVKFEQFILTVGEVCLHGLKHFSGFRGKQMRRKDNKQTNMKIHLKESAY